jgi:O-antigen ligase
MTRRISRTSVARPSRLVAGRPALWRNVVSGPHVRRVTGQIVVCLVLSAAPVLAVTRFGVTLTLFAGVLAVAAAIAVASPVAYAFIVLALAPLPDVGTLVGVSVPPGFDPLTLFVALGAILAVHSGVSFPYRNAPGLVWLTGLNLVLLAAAWMRTYGGDAIDGTSIALLVKPTIVVAAGVLVVQLLPRARVEQTLGLAVGGALLLIGASVALQRLGLYTTAAQLANADRLQLKQFGGVMISGNDAGAVVAAFTIPAYVLLRSAGYRGFALCVLLASFPIMLITLARGSLIALLCSLIALAVLDRQAGRGARTVLGVLVAGVAWTATVGRGQADILLTSLRSTSGDTNATLSGRRVIWDEVPVFLDQGHQRWLFGGGLDSFKSHSEAALGNAFATHNAYFAFLTNGGALMLVAAIALLVALWHVAGRARDSVGLALRTALVAVVVMGLSANVDTFTLSIAWIWPLAMAAIVLPREVTGPRSRAGQG